jgi:RNA polymerase sigma-70 factor (ECF subfamily)
LKNIIEENKNLIQSIIIRWTGKYNEDLEQEVYIKTWKNIKNYKEQNKWTQWISTITKNICKDYLKSKTFKKTSSEILGDEALQNVKDKEAEICQYDSKLRQKIILRAINSLPKKMKEVVILYEFEEKSYDEISKKLNIPKGTVKSRLNNARNILKTVLQDLL